MIHRILTSLLLLSLPLAAGACTAVTDEPDSASSNDALGDQAGYQAKMDALLPSCLPFATSGEPAPGRYATNKLGTVTYGIFQGVAKLPIAYAIYPAKGEERGALVLLPGRTEPFAKYCEVIYDLRSSGYAIYTMDLRGQGWSGRMHDDPQRGYVEQFADYVSDLATFTDNIVRPSSHPSAVLFGHSTGGAIATLYLEAHHDQYDAAVLVSPMHQINTSPYPESVAHKILTASVAIGLGASYAPGQGGAYDSNAPFEENKLTHSVDRFVMSKRLIKKYPELAIGGPTNQWSKVAIEATWDIKSNASELTTPFLMLQARQDEIVITAGQDEVCSKAQACTKVAFGSTEDPAGHELLMEKDSIRNNVLDTIEGYLKGVTQ